MAPASTSLSFSIIILYPDRIKIDLLILYPICPSEAYIKPRCPVRTKAGRIALYADGVMIGWHMLQSNMLYTKIFGRKIGIIFSPAFGITILSGL